MEINVKSEYQSGGETIGAKNVSNNKYIWKGRKQGFFSAISLAIIVEIIIRLIF